MTKRLLLAATVLVAAASFSAPASADPPCFSQQVSDCVERVCLLLGVDCRNR